MPGPRTGLVGVNQDAVSLAGSYENGIRHVGAGQGEAILGDHHPRDPVEVHRVDLEALIEVVDQDPVTELGDDRRGGRE